MVLGELIDPYQETEHMYGFVNEGGGGLRSYRSSTVHEHCSAHAHENYLEAAVGAETPRLKLDHCPPPILRIQS